MFVHTDLYKKAVEKFGKEHQLIVTFGELSECSSEIARHILPYRVHNEQDLIDELADVCIMMAQMKVVYGEELIKAINRKLIKLKGHIDGVG
jgi:NTP pyrophosphatase (non-canonical NTP hydrolase)